MMPAKKKIVFGTNSMNYWNKPVAEVIPLIAAAGYGAIEIWVEHVWRFNENPMVLAGVLQSEKLRCTVHCPVMDVNMTSANPGIRAESLRQMLESVVMTRDLGAELLIMHPGKLSSVNDSLETYWQNQRAAFMQIMERADRAGVRVAVENMDAQNKVEVVKTAQDIARVTGLFAPGKLGVIMDTTHMGSVHRILDFIRDCDDIVHVHLSDAIATPNGEVLLHLALGEGELDFKPILAALLPKYNGILSMETFIPPGNPEKIAAQRKFIESLL